MAVVYFFQNKWYELNTTPADTTWVNYLLFTRTSSNKRTPFKIDVDKSIDNFAQLEAFILFGQTNTRCGNKKKHF